ncbi:unnamed protein product [Alternaria burnsii]|nr:unnamed protein product [Alternaria burnsii]
MEYVLYLYSASRFSAHQSGVGPGQFTSARVDPLSEQPALAPSQPCQPSAINLTLLSAISISTGIFPPGSHFSTSYPLRLPLEHPPPPSAYSRRDCASERANITRIVLRLASSHSFRNT